MNLLVIVTLRECAGTGGDYQSQGASMSVYTTNFPGQAEGPIEESSVEAGVQHTRIRHRDSLGVNVTQGTSKRGQADESNGAHRADNKGVEDGGTFVGSPAEVAERRRPELRRRHC